MIAQNLLLLPAPRKLELTGETFSLPSDGLVALDSPDAQALWFSALTLQSTLCEQAGVDWEIVAGTAAPLDKVNVVLSVVPGSAPHPQGYEMTITPDRIYVVASAPMGIFYAVQTLRQILLQQGRDLPTLRCTDWPDFVNRGVMLDISRDKVPTLETLYGLVDLLAGWKVNQLQLYTEHTFAYRNHPVVWAEASPLTGADVLALNAYCRERFIELVPNQNSFGHMRRWLVHDPYRRLAECPHGCDTVWGHFDEPFTLYPGDPDSFNLVHDLYDELLPHFSSRQLNVGCDETVDLGRGRSKQEVEACGAGRVYLDFLLKIYRDVKARGFTMQFWGDVLMHHPELIPELPRDLVALEWGYEADHPFDEHGAIFAASGVPFYVCPGTSSWNTVAGRTDNTLGNLRNAAENGLKHGAVGYLNTDWGDNGHWQPLPVSYLGFAYGAAVSWDPTANQDMDIARAIGILAFRDVGDVMGRLAYDLGNVHQTADLYIPNSTVLFRILQATPQEIIQYVPDADKTVENLQATLARIDEIMTDLPDAKMQRDDADLIEQEFTWAANMLRHACWRGIWALDKAGDTENLRRQLADEAEALLAEYKSIWHARNRPGGFKDSYARLETMRSHYLTS
jgi:hexosaminidase